LTSLSSTCLLDRHPGDMETYGRPDALDEEIVTAGTCVDVLFLAELGLRPILALAPGTVHI
jgi:hypothetical protein